MCSISYPKRYPKSSPRGCKIESKTSFEKTCRLGCDYEPKLVPTWLQLGPMLVPKIDQNRSLRPGPHPKRLWKSTWPQLGPDLAPTWTQLSSMLAPKMVPLRPGHAALVEHGVSSSPKGSTGSPSLPATAPHWVKGAGGRGRSP